MLLLIRELIGVEFAHYRWSRTWDAEGCTFVLWLHMVDGVWTGLQAMSYEDGVEF